MKNYSNEEGLAIIHNFNRVMSDYSYNAQVQMTHKPKGSSFKRFTGAAALLVESVRDLLDSFGASITGEAVEELAIDLPDYDDIREFYDIEYSPDFSDMQDMLNARVTQALYQMSERLEQEKERLRQEQEERRERARKQAEEARKIEEKYKTQTETTKQEGRFRGFFRRLFGR